MRVEGVSNAEFSFGDAAGYVVFDTTQTSLDEILGELERLTGFEATERR